MKTKNDRRLEWLPATLAAIGFLGSLLVFGWLLVQFWSDIGTWARRDLRSQAELAAENLREPLRTQDFRKLTEFHLALEKKDMILRVRSAQGGWIFHGGYKEASVEEYVPCGDYRIGVAIPKSRVYEPFYEALVGFVLAVLVGMLGMFSVFFVLYRQRVRIRELAKLEKFRREFIADVSHEIKTPLTGILGAVDLLRDAEQGMRERLLAMLGKEATRLNGLVHSILDLARLEREGEALHLEEIDLSELVRETVETLRPQAEAKGVELKMQEVPSAGVRAKIDATLVSQALSNLVVNAIRHSGSPDVGVSLSVDGRLAKIAVEDHGVGIPLEHRAQVFERFHRVDASRAAETGGAGLGLAIVRRIARLHRGDISLEAVSPTGCRFVLALPIG